VIDRATWQATGAQGQKGIREKDTAVAWEIGEILISPVTRLESGIWNWRGGWAVSCD
jgi:hypothetical protein